MDRTTAKEQADPMHTWPRHVAFVSLVLFGILIPLGALLVAVLANLSNAVPNNPEGDVRSFQALIVSGMSGVLAVAGGVFSAVGAKGRRTRVLGLVAGGVGVVIVGVVAFGIVGFLQGHIR